MEILIALLVISIGLFVLNFIFNDYDVWNPGSLYFLFSSISIVSLICLLPVFKVKINMSFILLILIGMLAFFIGYNIIRMVHINKNVYSLDNNYLYVKNKIFTNGLFLLIMVIINVISIEYYVSQITMFTIEGTTFNEGLNNYRQAYIQGEIQIPFYIRQINRISMVMTYISCYSLASRLI